MPAQDISGSRQHILNKPGIIWYEADTHNNKSFLKWHVKRKHGLRANLNISKRIPTKVLQPGNGRIWAIGQESVSGEITHLNGSFCPPGSYLIGPRDPQVLTQSSTGDNTVH